MKSIADSFTIEQRKLLKRISEQAQDIYTAEGGLTLESADKMRENVIGIIQIPMGIATGFIINDKHYMIPVATEEKTIILQANIGARLTQTHGGFQATSTEQIMIGQIQVLDVPDHEQARANILKEKERLLIKANTVSRIRKTTDIRVKTIESAIGPMFIVEVLVDVKDSMGANLVDTICELLSPPVEKLTDGQVNMRIISNYATERLVHVTTRVSRDDISPETIDKIIEAYQFAASDPYRATTHNKGIMNGVIGVLMATSNDTRAVEAGAHAYAAKDGTYKPLSQWTKTPEGDLLGSLEMPMSVGTVGAAITSHPLAKLILEVLDVEKASELGQVAASVGLACNLGALYALVEGGIKSIQP